MDGFWGLLLNGIFGLIFAIIGYRAIIKGAQIQADAERQKYQRVEKTNAQPPLTFNATSPENSNSMDEVHWRWWAMFLVLGIGLWICSYLYESQTGFIIMLIFIFLGIPALTISLALYHPLSWKYSAVFVSVAYLTVLVFAIAFDWYLDIYEDLPLWAWTFANIGLVVVISLQREQSRKGKRS